MRASCLALGSVAVAVAAGSAVADDTATAREAMRAACAAQDPACDPVALLGGLERRALARALAARGLVVERAPWGKRVGRVHVVNLPVFGDGDGFLRWFNVLHVTTRQDVVAREVLLAPGQAWDATLAEETARRLRDPVVTTLAVVMPVASATPGEVDVLVVTRDVWSLRLNTSYRFEGDTVTALTVSLAENNLFGRRRLAAMVFDMDLGSVAIGPLFIDKNVAGSRIDVRARASALFPRQPLFDRGSLDAEGSSSTISVQRPLWRLDSRWGGGVTWNHRDAVAREFRGTSLRTYDAPETPDDDALPWRYRERTFDVQTSGVRGWGGRWKHRVSAGHSLEVRRPRLEGLDGVSDELQAAFARDVLPRSERNSVVFTSYQIFENDYREYRNVGSFELAEDLQLGVSAKATLGAAPTWLGSSATFLRASASAGYTLPWGADGTAALSGAASIRRQGGAFIDGSTSATLRVVTPSVGPGRIVAEARVAALVRETQNRFLSIGSDTGLRGFAINEFTGQRRAAAQLEARTRAVPLLFTRWGAVAFWDVGGAAERWPGLRLHHDVGFGARVLIPQLAPDVMRLDLAFPLDGRNAGRPRFLAGFQAEF